MDCLTVWCLYAFAVAPFAASCLSAGDSAAARSGREECFQFVERPAVSRDGDKVTIAFSCRHPCDATVAIEDASGRIVRHLASGVLGPKAPGPFQRNSLQQTLIWDGKDDQGRYVDDKDSMTIRVSLGLKPQVERNLLYDSRKRVGSGTILLAAGDEGVFVYDVQGCETVRLYDHQGNYVRTCYPFPADKVGQVQGLPWFSFPDGAKAPAKRAYFLATLLAGPESGNVESTIRIHSESTAMALGSGRIALAGLKLNRLASDGTSGGLDVHGPFVDVQPREYRPNKSPTVAAFSPDGKWLYLTGYAWLQPRGWAPVTDAFWAHGLYRLEYGRNDPPQLFLGEDRKWGKDDAHFSHPTGVAVDPAGRIYVADHGNDRVQIFSADGKLLRSLPVEAPTQLALHHKTGELYAFSWYLSPQFGNEFPQIRDLKPMLRKFSAWPELKPGKTYPLPLRHYGTKPAWSSLTGGQYQAALDSRTEPPTVWLIDDRGGYPVLYSEKPEGLVKTLDFREQAARSGIPLAPAVLNRQRLYVDHLRGQLYVAEGDCGTGKGFSRLIRIRPDTGKCDMVELPLSPEDMAIAPDGLFYLRDGTVVGRFEPVGWREVPFDYGEETAAGFGDGKRARLLGGLVMPSALANPHWHLGGMDVNVAGDLLVACFNPASRQIPTRKEDREQAVQAGKPYTPPLYPGRWASGYEMHIWDRTGRIKHTDVLPGQTMLACGVGLDRDDSVYANVSASIMLGDRPYYKVVGHRFDQVGTLVKVKPGGGKFVMAAGEGTPVSIGEAKPPRPPEMAGIWVDGAEWFYPGVGRTQWGMDCSCWNSRFTLDYFARSFAPEYDRYSVAVLDSAGNLVVRVGRYGNVDDADGLFDACYVATQTDRRLFIADPGNNRILSVKLEYHVTERVFLKSVQEK